MVKITEVNARERKFYVVKDDNGFWGIETNLFENGILIKKLNGLQGLLSETVDECINAILFKIEFEHLTSKGMNVMNALKEATRSVYNV